MTDPEVGNDVETIKTYRYVRLAMVGLVMGIAAAVAIQRRSAGDFQGSISAYYYTPGRGMFVAALLAIGVCLVCIRGGSSAEDILLNVAGMLAPVVALVPTPPDGNTEGLAAVLAERKVDVENNFPALLWIGVFGVVLLLVLIVRNQVLGKPLPPTGDLLGFTLAAGLVLAAYLWYRIGEDCFLGAAHYTAAISMFGCIAVVAVLDGGHARTLQGKTTRGWVYQAIGVLMIVAGAGIIGWDRWISSWHTAVLDAEAILIGLFALFWLMQTADLWNHTSRKQAIAAEPAADQG